MTFVEPVVPEVPTWGKPVNISPIEAWIDRAIDALPGFTNFLLRPVINFVRDVLHPIFSFVDTTINWVYHVVHDVFNDATLFAWLIGDLAVHAYSAAVTVARNLVNVATRELADLITKARADLSGLVDVTSAPLNRRIDDAVRYTSRVADALRAEITAGKADTLRTTRGWVDDAVHYASRVADGARALVAQSAEEITRAFTAADTATLRVTRGWVDDAVHYASRVADGARAFTTTAVGDLYRDVVEPLAGRFDAFLTGPWEAALVIINAVDAALDWIVWVTVHVVPEAIGLYRDLNGLFDLSMDDLLSAVMGPVLSRTA